MTAAQGSLNEIRVLEFASIGPGPFCGMLRPDLGADMVRVDRKGDRRDPKYEVTSRGRRSIALDLKTPQAVEARLTLMGRADMVLEGFRLKPSKLRFEVEAQRSPGARRSGFIAIYDIPLRAGSLSFTRQWRANRA
jgi:hypothetical protein